MTPAEFVAAVRLWQRRLGLERWRIDVVTDRAGWEAAGGSDDDTRSAFVNVSPDYDDARVHAHPAKLLEWDAAKGSAIAVHELLHLVVRDLEEGADVLERQVHRDAWAVYVKQHEHALEQLVDRLAWRLVELELELAGGRGAARRSAGTRTRSDSRTPRNP